MTTTTAAGEAAGEAGVEVHPPSVPVRGRTRSRRVRTTRPVATATATTATTITSCYTQKGGMKRPHSVN